MITFTEKTLPVADPITDSENFAKNLRNGAAARTFRAKMGNLFCAYHPLFENEVLLHTYEVPGFTVVKVCCELFHQKLGY